jgi:glycosyltransferase involved in cell wall biosynthesis
MAAALPLCDAFVTTSEASRRLITEHFPALNDGRFTVIEHGRDLARLELARPPAPGQALRVVFFGELTPAKGLKLILQLLELNRHAGYPIELHALGKKPANFEAARVGAIYHGTYERNELPELVRDIGPAVSLVPSPWPETYCHTLTESWAMGLPVLASDIGTLRERVLRHGGGWLLPVGDAERWLEKLRQLADDQGTYARALTEIRGIQFPNVALMARQYESLYERLLAKRAEVTRFPSG